MQRIQNQERKTNERLERKMNTPLPTAETTMYRTGRRTLESIAEFEKNCIFCILSS